MDMDFRVNDHRDSKEHGVTLFEGKGRIIIYLQHHENLTDIYSTIQHESIHWCLEKYHHVDIDEYQEHDLIFRAMWAKDYIPDESDSDSNHKCNTNIKRI